MESTACRVYIRIIIYKLMDNLKVSEAMLACLHFVSLQRKIYNKEKKEIKKKNQK